MKNWEEIAKELLSDEFAEFMNDYNVEKFKL